MAGKPLVESMNVISSHAKLRATLRFADSLFVAGDAVSGKMEVECKADTGLAMGIIMVELFGVEELTSRDHSATQPFLHAERIFQGPGLPPSNAVRQQPEPGESLLPLHYFYARKGTTTYWFRLPLPASSPSSINLGSGLAQVKYEVRATVGVIWKGQKQLVTDKKKVEVVESYGGGRDCGPAEGIVVSENGKLWMQGKVLGDVIVPGEPACVQLIMKNHSPKKNSGLTVTLTRELVLPNFPSTQKQPLQISDTLASVSFRGPEYINQPGVEGVANLVFDVPEAARSVRGDPREIDPEGLKSCVSALFEVRCIVTVKVLMGIGSKDVQLDLPVRICHPTSIPPDSFASPNLFSPAPYEPHFTNDVFSPPMSPAPYALPQSPFSPLGPPPLSPIPYVNQGHVWIPPPSVSPMPVGYDITPVAIDQYMAIPTCPPPLLPPRPSSAQQTSSSPFYQEVSGLPVALPQQPMVPLAWTNGPQAAERTPERAEGKGERATRVSHHLRISSRHRSVSPQAHRYALPEPLVNGTPAERSSTPLAFIQQADVAWAQSSPPLTSIHASPNLSPNSIDVASPRPRLSPRQSFSHDPMTHTTLTKSERVEALEQIAAETDAANRDMSTVVPDISPSHDKTLPGPPVPSSRTKPAHMTRHPRADGIFRQPSQDDLEEAPPTPTLAALKAPRFLRSAQSPSGLDALEARLLAEVGTRKPEQENRKPDVRTILPITIPRPTDTVELPVDSAISSLSLPSLGGANEGTLKLGPESRSNSPEPRRGRSHERVPAIHNETHLQPPDISIARASDTRKERTDVFKEKEHHKLKKMAQGRITAWLGNIDPDAPPSQAPTPPSAQIPLSSLPPETPPARNAVSALNPEAFAVESRVESNPVLLRLDRHSIQKAAQEDVDEPLAKTPVEGSSATKGEDSPNPRSSGFMPLDTLKKRPSPQAKGRIVPTTSKQDQGGHLQLPRGVVFPPPLAGQEARYDVRSARGGRGGKVTAVAAIWASAAQPSSGTQTPVPPSNRTTPRPLNREVKSPAPVLATAAEKRTSKPTKPHHVQRSPADKNSPSHVDAHRATPADRHAARPTRLHPPVHSSPTDDLMHRRAMMIKGTSVPAVISSSLAIPMLSTTASLVRPTFSRDETKADGRPPTVTETDELTLSEPAKSPPPKVGLAFGQARLRELIKKYQG